MVSIFIFWMTLNRMIDIETLGDLELDELQQRYEAIKAECDSRGKNRR